MPSKPFSFARRSLSTRSRSTLSRHVFNWATSLLKCPLKSPLNFFATYFKDGDKYCSRSSVKKQCSKPTAIPTTVPYCTDQVEICSILHKSFQSQGHTLDLWFRTSKLQVQQQTLPTNPFIWAAYCNSCIQPIGVHLLLPNIGSIQPNASCMDPLIFSTGSENSTGKELRNQYLMPIHFYINQIR
jgi:hypothetical protein